MTRRELLAGAAAVGLTAIMPAARPVLAGPIDWPPELLARDDAIQERGRCHWCLKRHPPTGKKYPFCPNAD